MQRWLAYKYLGLEIVISDGILQIYSASLMWLCDPNAHIPPQ